MSQDGFTLKDGHYKITQGFIPVVKVDGLKITYGDLIEDNEKTKIIKYGKVEKMYLYQLKQYDSYSVS